MTNEQLLERKAEMESNREKNAANIEAARANLQLLQAADHTMHGVIQDCDYWLERNNTPPDPDQAPAKATPISEPGLLTVLKGRRDSRRGQQQVSPQSNATSA